MLVLTPQPGRTPGCGRHRMCSATKAMLLAAMASQSHGVSQRTHCSTRGSSCLEPVNDTYSVLHRACQLCAAGRDRPREAGEELRVGHDPCDYSSVESANGSAKEGTSPRKNASKSSSSAS